jgi:fructose-specific phosphotransferase system IIA component
MKISDFLDKNRIILDLKSRTKGELLNEMGKTFKDTGIVDDSGYERFIQKLNNREETCSTGFQDGVAIPHMKARAVKKIALAFGISKEGIDFDALDKKPSKMFIMIAAPKENPDEYLKLLAKISEIFLDEKNIKLFSEVTTKEEVYEILDKYEM